VNSVAANFTAHMHLITDGNWSNNIREKTLELSLPKKYQKRNQWQYVYYLCSKICLRIHIRGLLQKNSHPQLISYRVYATHFTHTHCVNRKLHVWHHKDHKNIYQEYTVSWRWPNNQHHM